MYKFLAGAILAVVMATAAVGCTGFDPISPIIQLGIMWVEGEAHKYYNSDQETIHAAVKSALKDLEFPIESEEVDGDTIYITADAGDRFKIKIEKMRPNVTQLSIRVNIMGDKPYAELIYNKVDRFEGVVTFTSERKLLSSIR